MILKDKKNTNDMKPDNIKKIYGCDENPLHYMIEPRGSVDIVDEDHVSTPEDLEHILDW